MKVFVCSVLVLVLAVCLTSAENCPDGTSCTITDCDSSSTQACVDNTCTCLVNNLQDKCTHGLFPDTDHGECASVAHHCNHRVICYRGQCHCGFRPSSGK